uniref:Dirigent protein n=1 Tax=Ananas comosus var. bracteatus TaxID=296719 RepID=A0A6V7P167_ANACO|nr:unnamed protein product [Ananas comosus var. bracteatus]
MPPPPLALSPRRHHRGGAYCEWRHRRHDPPALLHARHPQRAQPDRCRGRHGPRPPAFPLRTNFGDFVAIDDPLTEGPALSSRLVGRAQGFYLSATLQEVSFLVSANFVLAANGPYNGSVVSVLGSDPIAAPVRELSVVGGSGRFRMAYGYVLWKTYSANATTHDAILELDVYLTTK